MIFHLVERLNGVVHHAGARIEHDDADPESFGAEVRGRVSGGGDGVVDDAFDEIGAAGSRELADGEVEEGAVAAETGGGGGGLEDSGEFEGVGLGLDGGLDGAEW